MSLDVLLKQQAFLVLHDELDSRGTNVVEGINVQSQEILAVDEVIAALKGVSGGHIVYISRSSSGERRWTVPRGKCDRTITELTERCLEVVNNLQNISKYIEIHCAPARGAIANAVTTLLSKEVSAFLQEVSGLEIRQKSAAGLSLAQLAFELHSKGARISVLSSISNAVFGKQGCDLISDLEKIANQSVGLAQSVALGVLKTACQPLFRMLTCWVTFGQLHDPYNDCFIKVSPSLLPATNAGGYAAAAKAAQGGKKEEVFDPFTDSAAILKRPRIRACRRTRALNRLSYNGGRVSSLGHNGAQASSVGGASDGERLVSFFDRGVWLVEDSVPLFLRPLAQEVMESGKYQAVMSLVRPFVEESIENLGSSAGGENDLADRDERRRVLELKREIKKLIGGSLETPATPNDEEVNITVDEAMRVMFDKENGGGSSAANHAHAVADPNMQSLNQLFDSFLFKAAVSAAHKRSSNALTRLYGQAFNLHSVVESSIHIYFMRWGDYFEQFLEAADQELKLKTEHVSLTRLQKIFATELRNSSLARDRHSSLFSLTINKVAYVDLCVALYNATNNNPTASPADLSAIIEREVDLTIAEAERDVTKQASHCSGCISLHMDVPAPLRVLFTPTTLLKYQLIFRHLAACKQVDSGLGRVWHIYQVNTAVAHFAENKAPLKRAFALRSRMSHFHRTYLHYLTTSVIEPQWAEFARVMARSDVSLDTLKAAHEAMLDNILRGALLTAGTLCLRQLHRIITTALLFCSNIIRYHDNTAGQEKTFELQVNEYIPPAPPSATPIQKCFIAADRRKLLAELIGEAATNGMSNVKYDDMISKFVDAHGNALKSLIQEVRKLVHNSNRLRVSSAVQQPSKKGGIASNDTHGPIYTFLTQLEDMMALMGNAQDDFSTQQHASRSGEPRSAGAHPQYY